MVDLAGSGLVEIDFAVLGFVALDVAEEVLLVLGLLVLALVGELDLVAEVPFAAVALDVAFFPVAVVAFEFLGLVASDRRAAGLDSLTTSGVLESRLSS